MILRRKSAGFQSKVNTTALLKGTGFKWIFYLSYIQGNFRHLSSWDSIPSFFFLLHLLAAVCVKSFIRSVRLQSSVPAGYALAFC